MSAKIFFKRVATGLVALWLVVEEMPVIKRTISAITGFDFIYEKANNPGWVGKAIHMALNPPPGTALFVVLGAIALIYWNTKPREIRMSLPVIGMLISVISFAAFGVWYLVKNQSGDVAAKQVVASSKPESSVLLAGAASATSAVSHQREFTKRTIRELRAFYEGRTRLQADAFMADEKGKLIEVEGTVVNVDTGMAFLQVGQDIHNGMVDQVECRFGPEWNAKLGTYRQNEHMKVRGVVGPTQNGAQIYLDGCEVIG